MTTAFSQQNEIQLAAEYASKGEHEKAYETYRSLAKQTDNLQVIHSGFFAVMIELRKFREARDYAEKLQKRFPQNVEYRLDFAYTFLKEGDLVKADKYFSETIAYCAASQQSVKQVADYFMSHGIPEYAERTYTEARKSMGEETAYALELANVLRVLGKKREMVDEYLNYVTQTPANTAYIRNLLQLFLTRPEDQDLLQEALLARVQKSPDTMVYADLLVWSMIQQKNFYGAFIQSRAFDKRFGQGIPAKTYELAQIAAQHGDYTVARRCYDLIVREYKASDQYLPSRLGLIRTEEAQVKARYPVNRDSIRYLIGAYKNFTRQFTGMSQSLEASISMAQLHAFQLDELDSAVMLLEGVMNFPRVSSQIRARAKLELGDIYLIRNEYWESTLLYAQVEKMEKDAPLGYEAKLRNARLYYFKGDFRLAEEHLDILEKATSREIANDAIDLSLRISENIQSDTLGRALSIYASAELLQQQNKRDEALDLLLLLHPYKEAVRVPTRKVLLERAAHHGFTVKSTTADSTDLAPPEGFRQQQIADDVYWLEAGLYRKAGNFQRAKQLLNRLVAEYPQDVLADDAAFMLAEIREREERDTTGAMELYKEFLVKYPGSVYAAEARKRFRVLRGDFNGNPEMN